MGTRLFAFGCSYTSYAYPTWADYLGVGFTEYYNYAAAGSSNTFIMNRLVEVNEKTPFNSETDLVVIMLTGFGRFSFRSEYNMNQWQHHGDLYSNVAITKNPILTSFLKTMWSDEWAVYQSWIAVKTIKNLLESKNVKHKILMGISNAAYIDGTVYYSTDALAKAGEIHALLDFSKTLDQWKIENDENMDTPFWLNIQREDGHPSHRSHYKFASEYFPNLMTDKAIELKEFWDNNMDYSSQENQAEKFRKSPTYSNVALNLF